MSISNVFEIIALIMRSGMSIFFIIVIFITIRSVVIVYKKYNEYEKNRGTKQSTPTIQKSEKKSIINNLNKSENRKFMKYKFDGLGDDWLKQQRREEGYSNNKINLSDMYDLSQYHLSNCDADKLKKEHIHDNTIDDGELKI